MNDPMDTVRDILYPGRRAPVTPINDDIQNAGDQLRDRHTYADERDLVQEWLDEQAWERHERRRKQMEQDGLNWRPNPEDLA